LWIPTISKIQFTIYPAYKGAGTASQWEKRDYTKCHRYISDQVNNDKPFLELT